LKIRLLTIISLACFGLATTACYDGWDGPGDASGSAPPPSSPSATKQIYLVLFETFYLSNTATTDTACFGATGTEAFRIAEWGLRVNALTESLKKIAETVQVLPRTIDAADCSALSAVEAAANDQDPSGVASVKADPLDRPIVHLKAVFWDSDVNGTFSGTVETPHWAAWRSFRNRGRRALSLHYFSISNSIPGHWTHWKSSLDSKLVLSGSPIDVVDPTDAGSTGRNTTVQSDAEKLAAWVLTKAVGAE